MGFWNGTKMGFKVNSSEEEIVQQFLTILGVNSHSLDMVEEIGQLSDLDNYSAEGLVEGDLLGLMESLEAKFVAYQARFSEDDLYDEDEEEYKDDKEGSDNQLDDIFRLSKRLFSCPSMYLAHRHRLPLRAVR